MSASRFPVEESQLVITHGLRFKEAYLQRDSASAIEGLIFRELHFSGEVFIFAVYDICAKSFMVPSPQMRNSKRSLSMVIQK